MKREALQGSPRRAHEVTCLPKVQLGVALRRAAWLCAKRKAQLRYIDACEENVSPLNVVTSDSQHCLSSVRTQ
eukprot:6293512-Amphidinium_carterae.1